MSAHSTDQLFRSIVEAAPNAIILVDRTGTIALVNCGAEALFGYTRDELIGHTIHLLLPVRFQNGHPGLIKAFLEAPEARAIGTEGDLLGRRKDGTEVPIEIVLRPIETADGVMTLAFIVDISARREEDETRHQMTALVESADDAIVIEDLKDIIQSWNSGAEHLLGYSAAEIIGQSGARLLPADRLAEEVLIVQHLNEGQGVSRFESWRRHRDGSMVEVSLTVSPIRDRTGRVMGVSTIMRDLTDRRRSEDRFRLVVEAAPSAMIMIDRAHLITLVNRRTEDLFGYSRAELLGMSIESLVPERFRRRHPGHVELFFAAPTVRAMGEGRDLFGLRKNGSEVPIEIGLNPIDTPEGPSVLASIIDITERKQYQDELRRSNIELEQFSYVVSHDLQEPLRMVANYAELLGQQYQGQLDARADKYIHYAVDGARRMQRMVADMLAYSRVGSQGQALVPLSVTTVLAGVLLLLDRSLREIGGTVETTALPVVLADEGQIHQLLLNLIGNAIKFRGPAPLQIAIAAIRDRDEWRFSVQDNGIGIDMQYADRVFQMFQRLHALGRYEGSGIGLSIARRILERHAGKIWVESTPGAGSTFFFTLRAADAALEA